MEAPCRSFPAGLISSIDFLSVKVGGGNVSIEVATQKFMASTGGKMQVPRLELLYNLGVLPANCIEVLVSTPEGQKPLTADGKLVAKLRAFDKASEDDFAALHRTREAPEQVQANLEDSYAKLLVQHGLVSAQESKLIKDRVFSKPVASLTDHTLVSNQYLGAILVQHNILPVFFLGGKSAASLGIFDAFLRVDQAFAAVHGAKATLGQDIVKVRGKSSDKANDEKKANLLVTVVEKNGLHRASLRPKLPAELYADDREYFTVRSDREQFFDDLRYFFPLQTLVSDDQLHQLVMANLKFFGELPPAFLK